MTLIEAVVCGIIQGAAEFLPISSSGHLALLHAMFGLTDPESCVTFDVMLHLATLAAVICVYSNDIFSLIKAIFTMPAKLFTGKAKELSGAERFALYIIIATVPLGFAFFLEDAVTGIAASPKIIGIVLILNGFMLLLGDRVGKGNRSSEELGAPRALAVGAFQLAAIVPGLSRSGTTITGGLICGLDRGQAVRFSFIMSVPAIIGANLVRAVRMVRSPVESSQLGVYAVGMVFAAVTGFFALKLLSYIAEKKKFGIFSIYCFAVGGAAVIFG